MKKNDNIDQKKEDEGIDENKHDHAEEEEQKIKYFDEKVC